MPRHTSTLQDLLIGCIAGASDVFSTHPLWTIKTLVQNNMGFGQILKLVTSRPLILYNGITANATSMIPITASRIALSSSFKKYLGEETSDYIHLISSGAAGAISSLMSTPVELAMTVKLKSTVFQKEGLSLAHNDFSNSYKTLRTIFTSHGITKVFTGYISTATRDAIYTAAFFTGTKIAKESLTPYFNNETTKSLVAYSAVSIFASFVNHPFDSIKTAQQMSFAVGWQLPSNDSHNSNGILEACNKIYSGNGIKGFWAGYTARGARFLLGLIVKVSIIDKMEEYWMSDDPEAINTAPTIVVETMGEQGNE